MNSVITYLLLEHQALSNITYVYGFDAPITLVLYTGIMAYFAIPEYGVPDIMYYVQLYSS